MIIHQISVFIENKPGRLTEIVSSLSEKGIDIRALIAGALGADLFRMETVVPYPENYDECTRVATAEKNANARPEIIGAVENFDDYDVIYLGYPIWWGDMPMAVYTFLESYDFSGKVIVPFCTHGGSGLAGTPERIQAICADATVDGGFAITGETAQNEPDAARERVLAWLGVESQR